ncbi:hypothetical protein L1987_44108 [Smallanthus sonchifolius]|uniref:Uncharacterized protein n=1 Tax=Smallanthus sonchifolius TaxID=185202 RepID=A0ACB9GPU2_9ASTR|nr:hypothetical protein L1987_44108 [Smallanthus sonchifolius]
MQMVVNSFDLVLGYGAAVPYTALAQKAMSRHFRCLKDAIAAQLKYSCELLGEKDVGTSGVTKGETPRLKLLEQSLRQQRAFHQMGMMEPEAWRPQRDLKVSNWFINARVRLWKPMVEEMYQQESKEEAENHNHNHSPHHQDGDQDNVDDEEDDQEQQQDKENTKYHNHHTYQNKINSGTTQTPMHPPPPLTAAPTFTTTTTAPPAAAAAIHANRSNINDTENDPSLLAINTQYCFPENQAATMSYSYAPISNTAGGTTTVAPPPFDADTCRRGSVLGAEYRTTAGDDAADIGSTLIRFGTASGDVSLTLGLRHAGNLPEKASFFS